MGGPLMLAGMISGAGQGLGQALKTTQAGLIQMDLLKEREKWDQERDLRMEAWASAREERQDASAERRQQAQLGSQITLAGIHEAGTAERHKEDLAARKELQEGELASRAAEKDIERTQKGIEAYDDRKSKEKMHTESVDVEKQQLTDSRNKVSFQKDNEGHLIKVTPDGKTHGFLMTETVKNGKKVQVPVISSATLDDSTKEYARSLQERLKSNYMLLREVVKLGDANEIAAIRQDISHDQRTLDAIFGASPAQSVPPPDFSQVNDPRKKRSVASGTPKKTAPLMQSYAGSGTFKRPDAQ